MDIVSYNGSTLEIEPVGDGLAFGDESHFEASGRS